MSLQAPRRPLILFIAILVLPCAFLVALGARMVVQDRELATKRLADRRQLIAAELARTIGDYLERLTFDETAALRGSSSESQRLARRATVFVAIVDSNGARLPWSETPTASRPAGVLSGRLAQAARAERDGRSADAENAYRAALRAAVDAPQAANAELQLARHLAARAPAAARSAYLQLLTLPLSVRDDEGVPFAFYAANALGRDDSSEQQAQEFVRRRMTDVMESRTLSPVACYAFADLEGASPVRGRCAELEQAEVILRDPAWFSTPRDGLRRSTGWTVANGGRWLVSRSTGADQPAAMIAIRLDSLIAAVTPAIAERPLLATTPDAAPLGRELDGLGLLWPAPNEAADGLPDLTAAFYASSLAIVLGVGLFGAYLLWRDVQRDIHLAQLRAQFVASVSHELKTPLTAIRIFAETLRDRAGIDPATRAEYLDTIARDSDRLTRLLQNVLDFSRIERGERTYRVAPQDFPAIVERALQTVRHPLERQGFVLALTVDRNLPPVACDADAVEQAVLNLVSNAAKYSGDSRRIEVRVTRLENEVLLAVQDYGIGVGEQYQPRLFERFYRAPTPDNELIQGTGLGLTLVAHFAAGHGGRMTVDSAPGKGSTFTLRLPCPPPTPDPMALSPDVAALPAATGS